MTTPRTIAGQAALSGMRPYMKRALGRAIVRIESEAAAPYRAALAEADQVLAELTAGAGASPAVDLVKRVEALREMARLLLAGPMPGDPG